MRQHQQQQQQQQQQQPVDRLAGLMLNLDQRMSDNCAQKGALNIALMWNDSSDLDLHVKCPCGTHIFYAHPSCSKCNAKLDVDMNRLDADISGSPVENVFWLNPPQGHYHIYVHNYKGRLANGLGSSFKCIVSSQLQSKVFIGIVNPSEYKTVYDGSLFEPLVAPEQTQTQTSTSMSTMQTQTQIQTNVTVPVHESMVDEWIPQARYDLTLSQNYDPSMPPNVTVIDLVPPNLRESGGEHHNSFYMGY